MLHKTIDNFLCTLYNTESWTAPNTPLTQTLHVINANVKITFDTPVIQDWINTITITADPNPIQTGDTTDIYANCYDNGGLPVGSGHTVYFFEKLEPSITMSASKDIIQTSDNLELYATVKDEDGSLAKGVKVYFYKEE